MLSKKGIPVSPGISIGEAVLLGEEDLPIGRLFVPRGSVDAEIQRFDRAVKAAVEEINEEIESLRGELGITRQILESHRDMIADRRLRQEIVDKVRGALHSAEHALRVVLREYRKRFEAMASEYLAERRHDLEDIERKLLRKLLGRRGRGRTKYPKNTVIVAHNLSPGETATLDRRQVIAFAIDVGGRTSHTAIMARALQIPAVVGLEDVSRAVTGGESIVVDGYTGVVIVDPDAETLEVYRRKSRESERFYAQLRGEVRLPAETVDGHEILLSANIELPSEIPTALEWGARGIGLYRTEFLYEGDAPDEETQFRTYREAAEMLGSRYFVVRTLDAGADKFHGEAVGRPEKNPFLGCRSIRLCLEKPALLRTQLRAILRASRFGKVRILFPMISNLEELRGARRILGEVEEELRREGTDFDPGVPVGIMVEVPSTALLADVFAKEVDFFSIGTNDLIQYSMAVDRVNERVAHLYQPGHPAILKLIRAVVEAGRRHGIGVSICGEMCGEPIFATVLLGLGLRSLSVSPISIPMVKRLIRSLSMSDAEEVARTCLSYETAAETQEFLESRVRNLLPDFF
ncbi:MAG: phosphoenolpyruvate--protein phosphotransferase [Planctomycetota bacterium]